MNTKEETCESYVWSYWFMWIMTICILILNKYYISMDLGTCFHIAIPFWMINISVNGLICFLEAIRFKKYLNKYHNAEAKRFNINQLTFFSSPSWGSVKWIETTENFSDPIVTEYKKNAESIRVYTRGTFFLDIIFVVFYLFF